MFTSRAEYRLMLREDNADARLTEKGRELGLVDDLRWAAFCGKQEAIVIEAARLKSVWVQPNSEQATQLAELSGQLLNREASLHDLLKRPQVTYAHVLAVAPTPLAESLAPVVGEQIEISVKYAGYVDRQSDEIAKLKSQEALALPADFDYDQVQSLSNEVRQKLKQAKPETLAHASRIPGVTPAAVSLLLIALKKQGRIRQSKVAV